jgi:hypothetical protein
MTFSWRKESALFILTRTECREKELLVRNMLGKGILPRNGIQTDGIAWKKIYRAWEFWIEMESIHMELHIGYLQCSGSLD